MTDKKDTQSIEQALRTKGYLLRPVEGDSMMPLLDQRTDLVKLIPVPSQLRCYDLPLYRRPSGALVLHRVIKVKRDCYITCGDNRSLRERVPKEWVVALAVGRFRGDCYLSFDDEAHLAQVRAFCEKRDRPSMRLRALWQRVFPPMQQMRREYTALEQTPLLLPFCYLARFGRIVARKLKRK